MKVNIILTLGLLVVYNWPLQFKNIGSCVTRRPKKTLCVEDEDLYSFMNYTGHDVAPDSNSLSKQLEDFLASKLTSIRMLKDYTLIAQAFLKANSTLPSSAAVERLFSVAGMILTPRRCKMSDKLFDKMVFLKGRSQ